MGLFGKSKGSDPKEQVNLEVSSVCFDSDCQVNEWCKKLRKEERALERQVSFNIQVQDVKDFGLQAEEHLDCSDSFLRYHSEATDHQHPKQLSYFHTF